LVADPELEELAAVALSEADGDAPAEATVLEAPGAVGELLAATGEEALAALDEEELLVVTLLVAATPLAVENPFTIIPETVVGAPGLTGAAEVLDADAVVATEADVAAPLPLLFNGEETVAADEDDAEGGFSTEVEAAAVEDVVAPAEEVEATTVPGAAVVLAPSVTVDVAVSMTVTDALPVAVLVITAVVWVAEGREGSEGVLPIANMHVFSSRTRGSPFAPTIGVSTIVQTSVAGPWTVSIVRVVVTVCGVPVTSPAARARIPTFLLSKGVGAASTWATSKAREKFRKAYARIA
jgi:hypothetical protein